MKKFLSSVLAWFRSCFQRKPVRYKTELVEELPDHLQALTVYVAGEGNYLWFAAMICPCGCGETLHMNLLADTRPRWSVAFNSNNTISLSPSVWRQVGCRSHFFFRESEVVWCHEHGSQ